jgi:hypothetical protein
VARPSNQIFFFSWNPELNNKALEFHTVIAWHEYYRVIGCDHKFVWASERFRHLRARLDIEKAKMRVPED